MGGSPITSSEMEKYYSERSHISYASNATQVFRETGMRDEFNPAKIKLPREACDSAVSPRSRGIIFAEDLTGSMDSYLLSLIQSEFPRLIKQMYEIGSFDPHIMFMGIGDVEYDRAPLQVTQFETDLRMLEQLEKIFIEKGGGGNDFESYILAWYFAGKHVRMDCWEKRREKGFLFTFGDEYPTPTLSSSEIKDVFADNDNLERRMITAEECLEMASEKFNCYHVVLHGRGYKFLDAVTAKWNTLMGENRVCDLSDHKCLPELVSTILKIHDGVSKTEALSMIENDNAKYVVEKALYWHEETISNDANCDKCNDAEDGIEVF